jgi:ZIP family zinc transporter
MSENLTMALVLTILAGLSTGIGSLIAFFIRDKSVKLLSFSMGLAGGVMLYLSFVEMLPHATHGIAATLEHPHDGSWYALLAFFVGMLLVGVIDHLIPHPHEHPDSILALDPTLEQQNRRLLRIGTMTAIALAIHNFPEGVATFVAALEDPHLGVAIAVAIALHNIPEGIAVSLPIYHATGNRKKAFWYSFGSGLVEPIGAILGYFLLAAYLTPFVMGMLMAGVAGIMVFISLDQLLPAAQEYDDHKLSIYGVVLGMLLMAISLNILVSHHAHVH